MTASNTLNATLDYLMQNQPAAIERLCDLLRIESISTDPAYKASCEQAANWLVKDLQQIGFTASSRPTAGQPMVVAHYGKRDGQRPHILFYGHYDVQPVDPLNLWHTPPFSPSIHKDDKGRDVITARGAADDKGQVMTFIEACRALAAVSGELPIDVTILLEGEEETGSPSLKPFLAAHKQELTADIAFVCDTSMWDETTPALTTRLRGLVLQEVTITCANRDLHSGLYGGAAWNPIRVLSKIIADIHDTTGRITIPGFYEGVEELSPDLKKQWQSLQFNEKEFLGDVGLSGYAGEKDRTVMEQIWSRPTCDVNGICGGYTAEGSKTVIPSKASAKFSFRLVGKQDPDKIVESFRKFVNARLPEGTTADFISHGASGAIELSDSHPLVLKTQKALYEEWNKPTALIAMGGSIPIVGLFKRDLGMDCLMVGFSLPDDKIHSPNEKYNVSSFVGGMKSWARILTALAE